MIQRLLFEFSYLRRRIPWDTGVSPPELLDFLGYAKTGRALDLGCGTGTNVIRIAQSGWQATGIDISSLAIRRARKKAQRAGVQAVFLQSDVLDLSNVEGPFDFVLDIGCFHSLSPSSRERYVQNLIQVLTSEGLYLLYTWIESERGEGSYLPSKASLNLLFRDGFEMIQTNDGHDASSQHPSAWIKMRRFS